MFLKFSTSLVRRSKTKKILLAYKTVSVCLSVLQGQSPSIRQLIMHSMAEWYMRGEQYDQAKLSRILDVAQDLKVGSNTAFSLTIKVFVLL